MSKIRLSFLGPAQLSRDNQPVELKAAKEVALLAYLALTAAPQNRERLVDLLWPDSQPEAARQNLRNRLWSIRKALGEEVVVADGQRLALSEAVWVDARQFEPLASTPQDTPVEQLQVALEQWRGPLLEGLTLLEAPDFELWLTTERERFGQLYLRAMESLVNRQRAAANWPAVIDMAHRALAYDSLQEPLHRALMEAYARLGRRPEALRQYDTLRASLAQELGVEPLPETETLRAAILNGALERNALFTTGAGAPVVMPAPSPPAAPDHRPATSRHAPQPYIGRQAEQAALDEARRQAEQGALRIVMISGELGIGKSSLWRSWAAKLPSPRLVLETRCLDMTQSLPFAPLTTLFNRPFCLESLTGPGATLSPIWLSELARLLPEIRQRRPDIPPPPALPPDEEQRRMLETFTQILRSLGGRPLVLFIDDLHWADRASLDWLVYMVERLRETPLLLVGAYRPADAPARLTQMVARWGREGMLTRLPLAQLTLAEAGELVAALGGDVSQVARLQLQSAGNPYFLIELSRAAGNDTPGELAELIQARLKRLPEVARQTLQVAGVLETRFDFETLRRASRRSEEETLDALDTLLEAAVLVEREDHYEFAHPLVATIVRADLSAARRRVLHRRAAEGLEASHAANLPAVAGQLVRHYAQANQPAEAARYAEMAAEHALALGALIEAAAFYRQAYDLEPTPVRQMELGYALTFTEGGMAEARQTMQSALAVFETAGDRANIVNTCLMLALTYLPGSEGAQVLHWVERAEPHLEAISDPEAEARLYHLKGAGEFRAGRSMSQAESYLARATRLAVEHHLAGIGAISWFELGNLWVQRGDLVKARESFTQALAIAQASQNYFQEALTHNNLGYAAYLAGDLAAARAHIEQGLAFVEARGLVLPRQYLYSTRGEIALAEEEFDEAEAWFKQAIVEAEKYDNWLFIANLQANLGLVARARAEFERALQLLTGARQASAGVVNPHFQTQLDLWLAELHWQRRERAAAETALAQAEARLAGTERAGLLAWAKRVRGLLGG
jgi:DNA-binding SARP family transcriptional activator